MSRDESAKSYIFWHSSLLIHSPVPLTLSIRQMKSGRPRLRCTVGRTNQEHQTPHHGSRSIPPARNVGDIIHQASYLNDPFETSKDPGYPDEAILMLEGALVESTGTEAQSTLRGGLEGLLHQRYSLHGRMNDLSRAIDEKYIAINAAENTQSQLGAWKVIWGPSPDAQMDLVASFHQFGQTKNLEQAIHLLQCVTKGKLEMPDSTRANHSASLGRLFSLHYQRTGRMEDLYHALTTTRSALSKMNETHTHRATALHACSMLLQLQFRQTKNLITLNQAINYSRVAVSITPPASSDSGSRILNDASILVLRYQWTQDLPDIIEAAECLATAEGSLLPVGYHIDDRFAILNGLGEIWIEVWLGTLNQPSGQPVRRGSYMNGTGLLRTTGTLRIVSQLWNTQHLGTPTNPPDRSKLLMNLARRLEDAGRVQNALERYAAAYNTPGAGATAQISAAQGAVRILTSFGRCHEAKQFATRALNLLSELCTRLLTLEDQQRVLRHASGLAAEACSLSLLDDQPQEAVLDLETSRAIILGHLLDNHTDLSVLRQCRPDLARRYELIQRKIIAQPLLKAHHSPFAKYGVQENISATIPPEQVRETGDVSTREERTRLSEPAPSGSHEEYYDGNIFSIPRNTSSRCDKDLLNWLWTTCVKPVFHAMESNGIIHFSNAQTSNGASYKHRPPHIWWIGSGSATFLPFHAAASSSGNDGTLNRTVPPYTPSIRMLRASRITAAAQNPVPPAPTRVSVVAMPTTPGQLDLPGVRAETDGIIQEIKKGNNRSFLLPRVRESPTAEEALKLMRDTDIIHIACHGAADKINPLKSSLLMQRSIDTNLRDYQRLVVDKLTVSQIAASLKAKFRRRSYTGLAFLSACAAAEVSAKSLIDEDLHIASALQAIGFPHVIGSLWSVAGTMCVQLSQLF
ncbi:CHAT domain-containing protein [Aspergillus transmontanensis]|uniref:CHAT domain-containing protein n=1 Tax=Aspergillus transmontanensis TaxID=1034304 RepID=A0A5N6VVA8_9EURO|nr:CHAT domain-containing protein [Aspergillus transmontanensis]